MATTIYQWEGWDYYTSPLPTDFYASGTNDYDDAWSQGVGGATNKRLWLDGYLAGQAMITKSSTQPFNSQAFSETEARCSWYGKLYSMDSTPPAALEGLCWFFRGTNIARPIVQVINRDYAGGTVELTLGMTSTSSIDYTGTQTSVDTYEVSVGEWHHYEFLVDTVNNYIRLYVDKVLRLSADGDLTSADACEKFAFHSPGNLADYWLWDHTIIYGGDTLLDTTGYKSLAVHYGAGCMDVTTGAPTVHSFITVGSTTYDGASNSSSPFALFTPANGDNYCPGLMNHWYDYWDTNPDTAAAWGEDVSDVIAFGLCREDAGDGYVLISTCNLQYIKMVSGYPIIYSQPATNNYTIPTPADFVKTNAAVDWGDTVANQPREDPKLWPVAEFNHNPFTYTADTGDARESPEEYIGIIGASCIHFTTVVDPPSVGTTLLSFAEEYRTDYLDWETINVTGEDFQSYFISGYKLPGGGNKAGQTNYITVNFECDADGSAYIQGIFDYALNGNTGRWGSTQQVYGPTNDVDYKHAFRKLKLRGHGKAMQVKVKSESGKPFYINGWAMFVTSSTKV